MSAFATQGGHNKCTKTKHKPTLIFKNCSCVCVSLCTTVEHNAAAILLIWVKQLAATNVSEMKHVLSNRTQYYFAVTPKPFVCAAFCKNPVSDRWYSYNDENVEELTSDSDVVTNAAYLLFYQRRFPLTDDSDTSLARWIEVVMTAAYTDLAISDLRSTENTVHADLPISNPHPTRNTVSASTGNY